jgi:membrane-bound ClpP family serine protease
MGLAMPLHVATHLSASNALLLLTAGIFLIYYELNRPGSIFPGALGLLASLLAIACFSNQRLHSASLILIATAVVLLALGLYRQIGLISIAAATVALLLGLANFVVDASVVYRLTAVLCGLLLGGGTAWLSHIARRARINKGLD